MLQVAEDHPRPQRVLACRLPGEVFLKIQVHETEPGISAPAAEGLHKVRDCTKVKLQGGEDQGVVPERHEV